MNMLRNIYENLCAGKIQAGKSLQTANTKNQFNANPIKDGKLIHVKRKACLEDKRMNLLKNITERKSGKQQRRKIK